ncbi:MAG: bifunctional phosphopantothenoylcysteine decarboxylase/phosphopantothenate--cysteine ligase CoaBC [Gammaproteobacteria bacterium]|nr:bifunctional phosphopantothenoylcysteine decarboxylase/phosphopantothenate--cysteine ligase CoaBC [Gammaproteobacteria bacterium]
MTSRLNNKQILLGISGGIAAYKSAELVRRLKDTGADVRVVMTSAACEFVQPLTFQALSGNPVHLDLLDPEAEAAMGHIELARWADAILIAPATANTLAKLTYGLADNLLTTLCLASKAPIAVAPAMNQAMWSSAPSQHNIDTLKQRGVHVFGPGHGEQACGDVGEGRMLEVADLIDSLSGLFASQPLAGVKVMVTAGPTYEAIDPVRFIGNRSSGKMGYAIAEAAAEAGASVTLVSGPTALACPARVQRITVESAAQMHHSVLEHIRQQAIFIATAAVADYRPAQVHDHKIKKTDEELQIHLQRNPDILAEVSALEARPFCVGFAAETRELEHYARDKMQRKQLDMIAANQVADAQIKGEDIGFNSEYNALEVFWPNGHQTLARAQKTQLARQLITLISEHYKTAQ